VKEVPIKLVIRASTLSEELSYLKFVLKNKDFFEKNGYNAVYPNNNLLQNPEIIQHESQMLEIFKNDEYDKNYYTNGINVLVPNKEKLENYIFKLKKVCKNW